MNQIPPEKWTSAHSPQNSVHPDNDAHHQTNLIRPQWKQQILDDFTKWLDELEQVPETEPEADAASTPDLETLLCEFTALRQEVRLQSRSSHKVGEQVERLANELTSELEAARTIASTVRNDIPKARKESREKIIVELLELIEGIRRTYATVQNIPLPRFLLTSHSRQRRENKILTPVRILNGKATDLMHRLGLEETTAVGRTFDAETMRALGTTSTGAGANTVTEILRQGYRLNGEVIRVAEVNVKKNE